MIKYELTENKIYDYIYCPARYSMKYESNMPIIDTMTVPNLIQPVIRSFCLNLMNGKVKSTDWLKQKWDAVCRKYPGYLQGQRVIRGVALLVNLFQYCRRNEIQVLDIDEPFELYTDQTAVKGKMGTISVRNKKPELLVFDCSQKIPNQVDLDMNLKYTMDCLAFRNIYFKELAGIRVVHVRTGKEYTTYRLKDDFLRLQTIIDNIAKAVALKIFYPRHNVLCAQCPEYNLCKAWTC